MLLAYLIATVCLAPVRGLVMLQDSLPRVRSAQDLHQVLEQQMPGNDSLFTNLGFKDIVCGFHVQIPDNNLPATTDQEQQ